MPNTSGTFPTSGISVGTTYTTSTSTPYIANSTSATAGWHPGWITSTTEHTIKEVLGRIDRIEKQLLIINPNEKLQKEFPALQEAYEAYQIVLKLVGDGKTV